MTVTLYPGFSCIKQIISICFNLSYLDTTYTKNWTGVICPDFFLLLDLLAAFDTIENGILSYYLTNVTRINIYDISSLIWLNTLRWQVTAYCLNLFEMLHDFLSSDKYTRLCQRKDIENVMVQLRQYVGYIQLFFS